MQRLVSRNAISTKPLVEHYKAGQIRISSLLNNNGDADNHEMETLVLRAAADLQPQLSRIDIQPNIQATATLNFSSTGPSGLEIIPSPVPTQPRAAAALISQQSPTQAANCTSTSQKAFTAPIIHAPKRKFQYLLDESYFCDVSNPTEHSRELTSKRTSQSVAEKGRRERMKSALQELANLLPKTCKNDSAGEKNSGQDGDPGEGDKSSGGGGGAAWANHSVVSIASMIESAIEYIRQLKKEVEDASERVRVAEERIRMRHSSGGKPP